MKKFKERCGAALLEVLISIAILGLLTVPISSGIMMSLHINAKSDDIMQAKLAVSSAVETIMAEGIESIDAARALDLPDITIDDGITLDPKGYWKLTVRSEYFDDIFVEMRVRSNDVRAPEGGGA
ncbi:MAG: type II secretion system protein [Oscillospiraceae bacterium]|nr:type II secretion system protein [Oscillospiraceae bacterium]